MEKMIVMCVVLAAALFETSGIFKRLPFLKLFILYCNLCSLTGNKFHSNFVLYTPDIEKY